MKRIVGIEGMAFLGFGLAQDDGSMRRTLIYSFRYRADEPRE